jgi:hypothetical protein
VYFFWLTLFLFHSICYSKHHLHPSSIKRDLNPQPLGCEPSALTTRPGFSPCFWIFGCFSCWSLAMVSRQTLISFLVITIDFISQTSSNSTLQFAGLQHMQKCQVNFSTMIVSMLINPNDCALKMVPTTGV